MGSKSFGILALGLGAVLGSAQAWAEGSNELIVRFREPQNSAFDASVSAHNEGAPAGTRSQLLNESEGIVKLSFKTAAEKKAAYDRLKRSARVLSVTHNNYYRPAVHYQVREISERTRRETFLSLPFTNLLNAWDDTQPPTGGGSAPTPVTPVPAIPEVLLPPASVTAGADPLLAQDWAYKAVGMDRIAKLEVSPSIITAVIDTGVDYNHEDLAGAMWRKAGEPKEVGYDFVHKNAQPFDVVHFDMEGCVKDFNCLFGFGAEKFLVNPGHGTHCAGHVAAVANNSLGIQGMGAGAPVMALKFFYDVGEPRAGMGDDAGAIQSIDYAIKNGAKVINASWGMRIDRERAEESELKKAFERARAAGVIIVVAAGNDGQDQEAAERPSFPAAFELDNIISVAAIDEKDELAKFSNYGGKSVHIAAPGVKILSTTVGSKYADRMATYKGFTGKEQFMNWDGTSMAAPVVAGAVAAVWSKYPSESYLQIRDRILKSARLVPALSGKVTTGGVLDLAAALGR